MSQEITNQCSVIGYLLGSFSVAHTSRLNHAAVVTHNINKANKAVVKYRYFLPSQRVDELSMLIERLCCCHDFLLGHLVYRTPLFLKATHKKRYEILPDRMHLTVRSLHRRLGHEM